MLTLYGKNDEVLTCDLLTCTQGSLPLFLHRCACQGISTALTTSLLRLCDLALPLFHAITSLTAALPHVAAMSLKVGAHLRHHLPAPYHRCKCLNCKDVAAQHDYENSRASQRYHPKLTGYRVDFSFKFQEWVCSRF